MRLVLHGHASRLLVARVQGIVERHASHPPVDEKNALLTAAGADPQHPDREIAC